MKIGVTIFLLLHKHVSKELILLIKKEMSHALSQYYKTTHKFLTNIAIAHLLRNTLLSIILHRYIHLH